MKTPDLPSRPRLRRWTGVWRPASLLGVAVALIASGAALGAAPDDPLPRWMAGCWVGSRGADQFRERWAVADATTMLGVGYTLRNGTLRSFEFLRVVLKDGRAAYVAQPQGAPPTEFVASAASDDEVTFENLAHDFPKRVAYRRDGASRLLAWIDDGPGSKQRIDYAMTRERCEPLP